MKNDWKLLESNVRFRQTIACAKQRVAGRGATRKAGRSACTVAQFEAVDRYRSSPFSARFERIFKRLAEEWKRESELLSSPEEIAMIPAYQRIIGLGPRAVPLIMRELEQDPDLWFWALRSITGCDPVPDDCRGDIQAMAEAWLEWWRSR